MATIDIKKQHHLSKDDARSKAEEIANDMKERLSLTWAWTGDSLHFEAGGVAKGTKGVVSVTESEIRVEVDLPFLLRVLKGTVESKIHEKLDLIP